MKELSLRDFVAFIGHHGLDKSRAEEISVTENDPSDEAAEVRRTWQQYCYAKRLDEENTLKADGYPDWHPKANGITSYTPGASLQALDEALGRATNVI